MATDVLAILVLSICWSSWCYLGPTRLPRRHQEPPRHLEEPPRRPQEPPRRPRTSKTWFFQGFSDFVRIVGHLGAILVQHGLQDAIKTLQDTSKSLQDALKNLQDALKTPPRRHPDPPRPPKIIDFPWFFQCFSDLFDLLVILVLSGSNMASKTPSRHSKAPPRASKTPSRTSKTPSGRLRDALKSLQDALKSSFFLALFHVFQIFSICWSCWCYLGPTWPPRCHQDPPRHSFLPGTNTWSWPLREQPNLPKEGAQGACMNSHAVGPRSVWAARPPWPLGTCCPLRGAPGCQPQDTATGSAPTWPPASGGGSTTARGLQFPRHFPGSAPFE